MTGGADSALQRALEMIEPDVLRGLARTDDGYVELLPNLPAPNPSPASIAMNNRVVAAIYEKLWRPFGVSMMGIAGMSMSAERDKAVSDLRLQGPQRVLDVACGPGNFTKFLSEKLTGDGIAIGFDISEAMIARAVQDNRGTRAAYVRGDAAHLPYADGTFDAVCCYAALYLIPKPMTVLDELIRVLRPGGRIAIMTSCKPGPAPFGSLVGFGTGLAGVRMFPKNLFSDVFAASSMTEIEQDVRGLAQFVSATKASSPTP
ncbi:MAG: class I SAM-dependent methyltransferase [Rhodococcus sp. (in: high G+C Gram-positive bacteria)]